MRRGSTRAAFAGEKKQLQALLMKKFQAAVKHEAPAQRIETAGKVRAALAGSKIASVINGER